MRQRLAAILALVVAAATLAFAIAVSQFPRAFRIRSRVLRVRIARKHPGASPSAIAPDGMWASVVELARIAFGHHQQPARSIPERPE